jgi:hypothetical protein
VQYVDGEQEWLALRNERVIWRLPPKDDSSDEGSSGDEDEEMLLVGSDGEAGSLRRSRKRRVSGWGLRGGGVLGCVVVRMCLYWCGVPLSSCAGAGLEALYVLSRAVVMMDVMRQMDAIRAAAMMRMMMGMGMRMRRCCWLAAMARQAVCSSAENSG